MRICEHPLYLAELETVAAAPLPWDALDGKRLAVSGASGMIGRFLIDTLALRRQRGQSSCEILAMSRSEKTAKSCFAAYFEEPWFHFAAQDVCQSLPDELPAADFILHAASHTHPRAYATDPVGTITANILGSANLLQYAVRSRAERFLLLSSVEVYGESPAADTVFSETDFGYLDCNTLRAGYPEGKRASEALCQAYIAQYGLDAVIVRLARIFGPTLRAEDSKASSQFLHRALERRDIVLKSAGKQFYSYLYLPDAVTAILYCLLRGEKGQAYNAADPGSDCSLLELARLCAGWAGTQVVFDLPDVVEQAGYSKATRAVLCGEKLRALGWRAENNLAAGVTKTLRMLSDCPAVQIP